MSLLVLFPHQLFEHALTVAPGHDVVLHEHPLFFSQYKFHEAKLKFHRETMAQFCARLQNAGRTVTISSQPLKEVFTGHEQVVMFDPVDDYLMRDIRAAAPAQLEVLDSPSFLCTPETVSKYRPSDRRLKMADFYIAQRRRHGILVTPEGDPVGGRWSFDEDNRKRLPPRLKCPRQIVSYPTTHEEARHQFQWFLENCFHDFGPYEDAMRSSEGLLFHSILTPALNVGLLTPGEVTSMTLKFAESNNVPIASLEGFLRQIIGWREFVRLCYVRFGRKQRTRNFFGFKRKLPKAFWSGTTGLLPADTVIRRVNATGYCHHIERLMVLGCLLLLLEIDPNEVYEWFMTQFIDAYDWVMVPNVYGMSQYADGGIMTTKPYLCGSSYLRKMGDWAGGSWTGEWDGLYWSFVDRHREVIAQNHRAGFAVNMFDKMPAEKRNQHLAAAQGVFDRLGLS